MTLTEIEMLARDYAMAYVSFRRMPTAFGAAHIEDKLAMLLRAVVEYGNTRAFGEQNAKVPRGE